VYARRYDSRFAYPASGAAPGCPGIAFVFAASASSPAGEIVTLVVRPIRAYAASKHGNVDALLEVAGMDPTPIVTTVSELRRDMARLIEKAYRASDPLFITQRGYVTAVLLSPQRYEGLRDAARSERERALSKYQLRDRRVRDKLYGPSDWETSRLMDYDEDLEEAEDWWGDADGEGDGAGEKEEEEEEEDGTGEEGDETGGAC